MVVMLWSSPMELIFKGSSQRRVLALTIDDAPS